MDVLKREFTDRQVRKVKSYYLPNTSIKQYECYGREKPSPKNNNPTVFKSTVYAKNEVQAKSRFFFMMKKVKKLKKANFQFLAIEEIAQDTTCVRNFGVWFRWRSTQSVHNYYKEFRDVSVCGAIQQMYDDMAGKHRAKGDAIQIIKAGVVEEKDCKKPKVTTFHGEVKFPLNKYKIKHSREDRELLMFSDEKPVIDNYKIV